MSITLRDHCKSWKMSLLSSYNWWIIIVNREMPLSRLLSPAARIGLSSGLGRWAGLVQAAIMARAQSADHQMPSLASPACRGCKPKFADTAALRSLRIRFCKLFVTVNIPIEEYFSPISVAINIPRHQIKFFCAFLIDPLLWILNTFLIRFLNTSMLQ